MRFVIPSLTSKNPLEPDLSRKNQSEPDLSRKNRSEPELSRFTWIVLRSLRLHQSHCVNKKGEMDKKDLLPQAFAVKDQPSDAVKIIKIIAVGVCFTTVVTVSVFFAIKYGTIAAGSMQQCQIQPAEDHKLMGRDLKHVTDLKMPDGQILQERFTYDYRSNSVMVQTPANGSGDYPVTFVIDYNRALVFVHVHEQDVCLLYSLREEFGQSVRKELSTPDRHVIDVASTVVIKEEYVVAGEIPSGFVETSSGPMVDGMCGGRTTYWLDRVAGNTRESGREKRGAKCTPYAYCDSTGCHVGIACTF